MKHIYYIFFTLIIILLFSIYFLRKTEPVKDNIIFLDQNEISRFLTEDSDKYISNLSKADLYARKVSSSEEYKNIIKKCGVNLTTEEKTKLIKCCERADNFLKQHMYYHFSCEPISRLKWKIACTQNYKEYEYEDGFPHTRNDVIFLSRRNINKFIAVSENDDNLTNTLVHEKIHVYQKQYPGEMKQLLSKLGYKKCDIQVDNRRANPDIDDIIYYDPASKECMYFSYTSNTPKNISDVKQSNHITEHPYEKMAYEIAKSFIESNIKKYKYI